MVMCVMYIYIYGRQLRVFSDHSFFIINYFQLKHAPYRNSIKYIIYKAT